MTSYQLKAKVLRNENLAPGIVRLTLDAPQLAVEAIPGQFVMVKAADKGDPLLRRPFSIHQATSNDRIQLLVKVLGKGTSYLSKRSKGDYLDLVGPLGNGFTLPHNSSHICIVGGGIGIAPLFFLLKNMQRANLPQRLKVLLGAATAKEIQFLKDEFTSLGTEPIIATDDGSLGYHGFVTSLLPDALDGQDCDWHVYSCGPKLMMQKVAEYSAKRNFSCQVSLETVMACGISACLGCTVRSSREIFEGSGRSFLHVCKDGPVFNAGDVAWT